jgi:hypothetical protein
LNSVDFLFLKSFLISNELEVTEKSRQGESLMQQAYAEFGVQAGPDVLASASIVGIPSTAQQSDRLKSELTAAATKITTKGRPQYAQDAYSDTTSASVTL